MPPPRREGIPDGTPAPWTARPKACRAYNPDTGRPVPKRADTTGAAKRTTLPHSACVSCCRVPATNALLPPTGNEADGSNGSCRSTANRTPQPHHSQRPALGSRRSADASREYTSARDGCGYSSPCPTRPGKAQPFPDALSWRNAPAASCSKPT